jgi:hypothetical protein
MLHRFTNLPPWKKGGYIAVIVQILLSASLVFAKPIWYLCSIPVLCWTAHAIAELPISLVGLLREQFLIGILFILLTFILVFLLGAFMGVIFAYKPLRNWRIFLPIAILAILLASFIAMKLPSQFCCLGYRGVEFRWYNGKPMCMDVTMTDDNVSGPAAPYCWLVLGN